VGEFWANLAVYAGLPTSRLIEKVWVADRCQHLNSNAISTMPLRHYGSDREPAWVSNPDPAWFPNGISDAMYAIVSSMYGYGDAFLYITDRYSSGYPSAWTVLNPEPIDVNVVNGRRTYRSGQNVLNPNNVVQISRNPSGGVRGTSALKAFSAAANGLLAASELSRVMMAAGGTPTSVIKSNKKLNAGQAEEIQRVWMTRVASRGGAPAVLGPDLDFTPLSFSPAELMLLDVQTYLAQIIAAGYGVPAQMVNLPLEGGLNYQTPVLMLEQWWRSELRTTAGRISTALSSNMLPAGQYVQSDAREFLAPSQKELVEAWEKIIAFGGATAEEFRVGVLKLPPTATLEDLGTPPSAGASPAQQSPQVVELRPTGSSGVTY
jgi:HK97 family phage portal protein